MESGRASAIQDLAAQTAAMAERGKAVETTLIDAITAENDIFKRRNRVLVGLVIALLLSQAYQQYRSIFITGPKVESIEQTVNGPLADANSKLDKLTKFVDDLPKQQSGGSGQSTQLFIDLLCTTSDPVTLKFCVDHGLVVTAK
jgi:hypothetical protein